MKRTVHRKKRAYLVFFPGLICAIATMIYGALFVLTDDTKPPQITMDSQILDVSVGADETALLAGVTAKDDKDGDVTSGILVEKISSLKSDHTATVTYAAFDSAGNVAKATRTVCYTDYQAPRFYQVKALTLVANSVVDIVKYMGAEDQIDGDISNQIKGTLLSNVDGLNNPGIYELEFRVSNSMSDTAYIRLPVEVYPSGSYNANVELSEYLVYTKVGEAFRPEAYLENLVVGNQSYALDNQNPSVRNLTAEEVRQLGSDREQDVRTYINSYVDPKLNVDPFVHIINVDMDSNVDVSKPGVYSVTYTVDYKGTYKGYTRLNVVVEE